MYRFLQIIHSIIRVILCYGCPLMTMCFIVFYCTIVFIVFQRTEKEQKEMLSKWTELGTDEPGKY